MIYRRAIFLTLAASILMGATSIARAAPDDRAVVRDTEEQIVHSTDGTCVRSDGTTDQDSCAPRRVVQQAEPQPIVVQEQKPRPVAEFTREDRTVYFEFNHSNLSSDALGRLDTLVDALKADSTVKEARIVGYADRIGSVSYNDRLSQKRAQTLRDYIVAKGYTNARVTETRWVGKSKPSTNCPAREKRASLIECLQNDRRVEVEIGLVHDEKTPVVR